MRYSVIIPCYKSDQTIEHVVDMTRDEMIRLGKGDVEFVLVNDCSPDGGKTIRKLREMAQKHADVKVIGLAKNSGQHNALMAALRHAEGDIIIGMDDDGQTHPSQLSKLLGALDEGYDLVYGYYPEKKHNWFRNLGSRFNDLTVNMMIKKPKEVRTSSYFVVRKFVRDYTIQYEGSYTYLLGLFMRCTQNIASVPVQHFERESGESGYTLGQLIRLWSSIIGFSVIPLRIASIAGFFFAGVGLLMALFVLIRKCIDPNMSIGWPSLMCAISFFFGLNFIGVLRVNLFRGGRSMEILNMGFFTAVLFGAVFSVSWTPCVGAFLGSALMLASQQGQMVTGMVMLFCYSMGLGIPFLVSALLIDHLKGAFGLIKKHYGIVNRVCGGFLILVGILMATGTMGRLMVLLS